jgi:hypothetical protein
MFSLIRNNFAKLLPYFLLSPFLLSLLCLSKPNIIKAQTGPQVYWGALISGSSGNPTYPVDYGNVPYDMRTLSLFEINAGKKTSIVHFAIPWKDSSGSYSNFPSNIMTSIRNHGSIPMLNWGSWQLGKGVNQPAFKLTNITRGDYDTYLTQFAKDAKAWGSPFFFRFDHEMNIGGQFSWNYSDTWTNPATGTNYKNSASDFINMWRHVVNIFNREGATNVTWVWCPNIYFRSGSKALPFMQGYPGDSYVDWTCVDGYNKSTSMTTFSSLFTDSYNVLQQKVSGADTACSTLVDSCNPGKKPMMIGEWATVEAGDGGGKKAAWIKDALLTQLPNNFPKIKAVVWFNWNTTANQIIESTSTALSGFKTGISLSYFAANNFGSITTSPIAAIGGSPVNTPTKNPSPTIALKPGDADGNGIVDVKDLNIMMNNYSKLLAGPSNGDFNNDSKVNAIDFAIWQRNYRP